MKHHIFCLILALTFVLTALAACSNDSKKADETTAPSEVKTVENVGHPLYVRVKAGVENVSATFSEAIDNGVTFETKMTKVKDEDETEIYCCHALPEEYDRVTVTVDDYVSDPLAFNNYTDGWELYPETETPFIYGAESEKPDYAHEEFPYQDRTKGVLIWTPKDYDAKSKEKYSVIYMTDGQNLFDPDMTTYGSWAVAESAASMLNQSDNKVIIVGIENADGYRDDELTPNLGTPTEPSYEDGHGAYFCDFVVNTVMPYVEKNYNVYTDREHTAMCGSSSGGIESFYIAMEHPEKFGCVGALSPAFGLFEDATWQKYLKKKEFSAGYPRVYLYCGLGNDLEEWLLPGTKSMPDNLSTIDYPLDRIYSVFSEGALHNEQYWRILFPDFLKYLFA